MFDELVLVPRVLFSSLRLRAVQGPGVARTGRSAIRTDQGGFPRTRTLKAGGPRLPTFRTGNVQAGLGLGPRAPDGRAREETGGRAR